MYNKNDLIKDVAENTGATKLHTKAMVNEIFTAITDALIDHECVSISGFGRFEIKNTAERVYKSPADGSDIICPARKRVTYRVSDKIKHRINEESADEQI